MPPPRPIPAPRRARRRITALAAGLCCALGAGRAKAHAEAAGVAHVELGAAVDSNAGRDLDPLARGDGLLLGELGLEGTLAGDGPLSLAGRYALGAKRFLSLHEDDLLAQELSAELNAALQPLTLSLQGRLKDRRTRGSDRDYSSAGASVAGARRFGRLSLQLELGAERFIFRSDPAYSDAGPRARLEAGWTLTRRHRLGAEVEVASRLFDPESRFSGDERRRDGVVSAGAGYHYKGPVLLSVGYGFLDVSSNQPGRSLQRHRLEGALGLFLPGQVALALNAAVQRTRFPDGLTLSPELLLTTDDENTNSATLSLSRRFESGLQVELRGAGYLADFAGNDLHYRRAVAQLTLGWDGPP